MLEELYELYNRRRFVHPDPLEYLYRYEDVRDREVVGLIASALAYGRVAQILLSIGSVLDAMGPPVQFLRERSPRMIHRAFDGFKHRWTTGPQLAALLVGIKHAIERHGSLETCFAAGLRDNEETLEPALTRFVYALHAGTRNGSRTLLPDPARGSACKRLHLFLRWMVRHDDVDPGGWNAVPRTKLIIPLDTHMHRIAVGLGLTARKQANARTAYEVTAAFRRINPDDPVKYDFALTRVGIRNEMDVAALVRGDGVWRAA